MWVRLQVEQVEPVPIISDTCWAVCLCRRNLDLGRKSTMTLIFAGGNRRWLSFGFKWSFLIKAISPQLPVLYRTCCQYKSPPRLLMGVCRVRCGSLDNFVSSVPLCRGVNLCTFAMLDCVVYTYTRIHLYSLMHLMPTTLFQALSEVEWSAKVVLFTISVSRVTHTPTLQTLFSGPREWISCLVSPPDCVYIQI